MIQGEARGGAAEGSRVASFWLAALCGGKERKIHTPPVPPLPPPTLTQLTRIAFFLAIAFASLSPHWLNPNEHPLALTRM